MNSEHHITAYFESRFRVLAGKKKRPAKRTENHPLNVEIRTTYNIACEVLGADVAGELADKAKL